MPQFDFYSYPEQIFYVIIAFLAIYFISLIYYGPQISSVLKTRKKLENIYLTGASFKKKKFKTYYTSSLKN